MRYVVLADLFVGVWSAPVLGFAVLGFSVDAPCNFTDLCGVKFLADIVADMDNKLGFAKVRTKAVQCAAMFLFTFGCRWHTPQVLLVFGISCVHI